MAKARQKPSDGPSEATLDAILAAISQGKTVTKACEPYGIPPSNFRFWATKDMHGLAAKYARARESQAHVWAEEIMGISDDADPIGVQVAKLRVDSRKWLVSKILPREYGDKIEATHAVTDGLAELLRQIRTGERPGE